MHYQWFVLSQVDISSQIKLLQADLPAAKEALDTAEKLAGCNGGVREAKQKLRDLMKEVSQTKHFMFDCAVSISEVQGSVILSFWFAASHILQPCADVHISLHTARQILL